MWHLDADRCNPGATRNERENPMPRRRIPSTSIPHRPDGRRTRGNDTDAQRPPRRGRRGQLEVLALARKHGPAVVDDAAKAALDLGVPTYHFIRRYLERRPPVPLTLRQVDPLIRQLTLYRDLIDRRTGDSE
jgi:hypothetical protein